MENENSKSSSSSEEDSEYSDIDSDRPNLLQINKKIDKMNRKKNISLLEKKRNRNKNFSDIIFDANKKTIEDSFIPNLEELNDFLKNCKIEEIKIEELEKIPKEKIFDPDLFIEENYGKKEVDKNELKHSFSIEDLGFEFDIKEKNDFLKEEKLEEDKIYDSKKEDKLNLNEVLQEKDIKKQKKEIHELIEKINKMSLEDIKKTLKGKANTKLNIVFDLDNTCIFAQTIKPESIKYLKDKYPKKDFKIIKFEHEGNIIITAFIIREGLQDFFDFTKNFCNFYVSTLGANIYGSKIKDILSNTFGINFLGFKGRIKNEQTKYLKDLNLDSKNTVIFDDCPGVWIEDKQNVIISKHFTDRDINNENLKRLSLQNNIYSFLQDYKYFFYYSSEENWQNQKLKAEKICPFYDFRGRNCFSGEYLESSKYQFIFMEEIIKIIYYLIYNSNIGVPEALKLIRYNIFYNYCFDLDFYKKDGNSILKDIIINCGGEIYNPKEKNKFKDMKFLFVCSSDEYNKYKEDIKKAKKLLVNENAKVVNDKYILNCFYFMNNLENELSINPNYCLDLNEEENYDNY